MSIEVGTLLLDQIDGSLWRVVGIDRTGPTLEPVAGAARGQARWPIFWEELTSFSFA